MKNKFKTMAIACMIWTIIGGFMTSCNNDELTGSKNTIPQEGKGEPTWMTLNISFPTTDASALRASTVTNETAIDKVDVFIYSGEGDYYSSHTQLGKDDFDPPTTSGGNVVYQAKPATKIPTTTGDKKIFVGVNLPSSLVASLENKSAIELRNVTRTFDNIGVLVTANGIAMTNAGDSLIARTFKVGENNVVNIMVQRMVAKITVAESEDPKINIAGVDGTIIYPLQWTIGNYNKKSFLLQNIVWNNGKIDYIRDPNYWAAEFNAGDFVKVVSDFPHNVKHASGDNLDVSYTTENTSDRQLEKEITSVIIRAQFIPKNIVIKNSNGDFVNATSSRTTAATFWAFIVQKGPIAEIAFFETEALAKEYAGKNGAVNVDREVLLYESGYCYWHLFLREEYDFKVVRNTYYKCNITRIVFPGKNTPDIPNPEEKPDVPTTISATLTVLPWQVVSTDYELAP
jgi:hypothetical protein